MHLELAGSSGSLKHNSIPDEHVRGDIALTLQGRCILDEEADQELSLMSMRLIRSTRNRRSRKGGEDLLELAGGRNLHRRFLVDLLSLMDIKDSS